MSATNISTLEHDILIVGAGPVGCVVARELADKNLKCLIIDKRSHPGGNCYDEKDEHGVLIHKYGPHFFRTNLESIVTYLSRFTEWVDGDYVVKSSIDGELYPIPINLDTLEKFFHCKLDEASAKKLLEKLSIKYDHEPKNSEEFVLSRVGKELYEAFYLGYTLKQWELHPRDLAPSVCGRIPLRFNRYDKYVDHKYQIMPKNGYTHMYRNMIDHPNIETRYGIDYLTEKNNLKPKKSTLYTGPIDSFFDCRLGALPWRSLHFEFKNIEKEYVQPCASINFPSIDVPYTRTVEIKHATGQIHPSTTISYEYSRAHGDPYYPIANAENQKLYEKYRALAQAETKNNSIYFAGRLAEYAYINMDESIERALQVANTIWCDVGV